MRLRDNDSSPCLGDPVTSDTAMGDKYLPGQSWPVSPIVATFLHLPVSEFRLLLHPHPHPPGLGSDPSCPTELYAWIPSYNSQTTANAVQRALKGHRPPQHLPWVVGRGGGWPQASATQTRQKVLILPALIPVAPTPRECPACQLLLCPRARVCVQVTVLTSGAVTPCQCPAGVGGILTRRQGARPTDTDARRLLSGGRTGAPLVGPTACTSLGICETGKVPPWAVPQTRGGEFECRAWLGNAPG